MEKNRESRLFGTDGIRKAVGDFPLDDDSIVKLGRSIGTLARDSKVIIGRDTRDSGENIEKLIGAGMMSGASGRCKVFSCGVIPTPGLSFVTDRGEFDYGIMITASHNPYTDNGIKIFGSDGEKIPETMENRLEDIFFQLETSRYSPVPLLPYSGGIKTYRDFLSSHATGLKEEWLGRGIKLGVVLDCANGATYEIAPRVFREAGIETAAVHSQPDGKNINRQCGSTHIEKLKEAVEAKNLHLGIAFDGDGDRVLFMDSKGRIIEGDHTLYIIAKYFLKTREDFNKTVVGTVMENLALEKALDKSGIRYTRTPVGDKYVYREMKRRQAILGGEQSGHTILRSFQKTGDGILTALYFLKALAYLEVTPSEAFDQLVLYPQVMKNIRIREKKDLGNWQQLNRMIDTFNETYGNNSRLLIRYSGTEPKIRVMMESEHRSVIDENIGKFENLIQSTIGE